MAATPTREIGDWVLTKQIGRGSFAVVWKAAHKQTGQEVAVKEISTDKLNKKLKQSLESEVSILRQIQHRNIVHLLDVIEVHNHMYLVMEFCAGGDLAQYISRCRRVPEVTACAVMRQLAAGLRELWYRNLVHRDLKPQNLLLSDNTSHAVLKIADFGFARNLELGSLADTLCGSPLYMAPEILQFHKYDAKADLWSVGTILYELLVGRPPFNGANHVQLLRNIERQEARIPDQIACNLSEACRELIYSLLRRNPVERIGFEEFFRHPFLAGTEAISRNLTSSSAEPAQSSSGEPSAARPVQLIAGRPTEAKAGFPVFDDEAVAGVFVQPLPSSSERQPLLRGDSSDPAASAKDGVAEASGIPNAGVPGKAPQPKATGVGATVEERVGRRGLDENVAHLAVQRPRFGGSRSSAGRRHVPAGPGSPSTAGQQQVAGSPAWQGFGPVPPATPHSPSPVGHSPRASSTTADQSGLQQQNSGEHTVQRQNSGQNPLPGQKSVSGSSKQPASLPHSEGHSTTSSSRQLTSSHPLQQQAAGRGSGRSLADSCEEEDDYVIVHPSRLITSHASSSRRSSSGASSAAASLQTSARQQQHQVQQPSPATQAPQQQHQQQGPGLPAAVLRAGPSAAPQQNAAVRASDGRLAGSGGSTAAQQQHPIMPAAPAGGLTNSILPRFPHKLGRLSLLLRVVSILDSQATTKHKHGLLREALTFRLLALQVLVNVRALHAAQLQHKQRQMAPGSAQKGPQQSGRHGAEPEDQQSVVGNLHEQQAINSQGNMLTKQHSSDLGVLAADAQEQPQSPQPQDQAKPQAGCATDGKTQAVIGQVTALTIQQRPSIVPAALSAGKLQLLVQEQVAKTEEVANALSVGNSAADLPSMWAMLYQISGDCARAGAVDELMGNLAASAMHYFTAGCLYDFLCNEASSMTLQPPLRLAEQDRARLQRYMACISFRHTACHHASAASGHS